MKKAQIKILNGPRAGIVHVFSQTYVAIGRHPESDLQFDPHQDLDVSVRHAALLLQGEKWMLRDLESRNGTLVNGHPIKHDTKLDDTDQIRFGPDGPMAEFRLVPESTPDSGKIPVAAAPATSTVPAAPRATPSKPKASPSPSPGAAPRRSSTTQRVRVEVKRQTQRLRQITGLLVLALVVVIGAFLLITGRQRAAREQELAQLQAELDSIVLAAEVTIQSLQGEMAELGDALSNSQRDVQSLQSQLATAEQTGNAERIASLRRELDSTRATLRDQQLAAQTDFRQIVAANENAVALITVQFRDGPIEQGTAFAVRPNGTMITNRHVVAGRDGTRQVRRIAIQLANSAQIWRGEVLSVSQDREIDLAVIRVLGIDGAVPVVRGFSEVDVAPGAPVAAIGFPAGAQAEMLEQNGARFATTTVTAGTVSKVLPKLIQVNGYGTHGSSGSPIFDSNGRVVAILYGGEAGTGGRLVNAVPVTYATELLASIN